jgi:hypothetical protein
MAHRLHRSIASQRRLQSAGLFKADLAERQSQRHCLAGQGLTRASSAQSRCQLDIGRSQ